MPNDDPVDTLTVKVAPAGALFCDNVRALVIPLVAGKATVPFWVIGIETLWLCDGAVGFDGCINDVGTPPPPPQATRIASETIRAPLKYIAVRSF